jgi:phosphoenolpyruvate phosphomutase
VYLAMSVDFIHHGHLRIIEQARSMGRVIVGLLTDRAISQYKRLPLLTWEQRREIVSNIKGIDTVVAQDTLSYADNLRRLKPDVVLHGDEWRDGLLRDVRQEVIDVLVEWGGELVEVPHTPGVSTSLDHQVSSHGLTPESRTSVFRRLLRARPIIRLLEVHNGLTGLIVESVRVEHAGRHREFDGMWLSSLTDSTAKGKPDIGCVDLTSRLATLHQALEVTTKPLLFDGDTGGPTEHFMFTVRTLERLGCAGVVIEDKVGLKRNSLLGTGAGQVQADAASFCDKIAAGKRAQAGDAFMVIARIESLILNQGMDDALRRARAYVGSGADGILIHSRSAIPDEVLAFCRAFRAEEAEVPLVVVPSTYDRVTEDELADAGVNVVIYANHLLRSAYPAMVASAESILLHGRCHEASERCMSIPDILRLIPEAGR